MAYGTIKVDTITFTNAGSDQSITVSGIVQSISGNITATGTIQGQTIIGTSTVSGATVTGNVGSFTTLTGGIVTLTSGVFASGTAAAPSVSVGTTTDGLYSPGTNQLAISTGGTGRLFVDSSGRILVGTSSAFANVYPYSTARTPNFQLAGNNEDKAHAFIVRTQNDGNAAGGYLTLGGGSTTYPVAANHAIGGVNFNGFDGTNYRSAAQILCSIDGTPGANDMPGRLVFSTTADGAASPTERARIDSSGRLLVGTSSSIVSSFSAQSQIQTAALNTGDNGVSVSSYGLANNSARLDFNNSNGTSIGAHASLNSGNGIGLINFNASDGTNFINAARIAAQVDGTPGTNDMPGRLVFSTTADGASSPTERLRITSTGLVGIGTSAPVEKLHIEGAGTQTIRLRNSTTGSNASPQSTFIQFYGHQGTGGPEPRVSIEAQDRRSSVNGGFLNIATANTSNVLTNALHIDNQQRVGIGTTSPADILTVQENKNAVSIASIANTNAGVAAQARFKVDNGTSSGSFGICGSGFSTSGVFSAGSTYVLSESAPSGGGVVVAATEASSTIRFATGGLTERARIDSSGRLLVGTSTSVGTLGEALQVVGTTQATSSAQIRGIGLTMTPSLVIARSRGTTATPTVVGNNDGLASLYFTGYDGSADIGAASIAAFVDGTPGLNDMPGRLVFSTTADGASSPTERLRIDSSGRLLVGTSSALGAAKLETLGNSFASSAVLARINSNDTNPTGFVCAKDRAGAVVQNNDQLGGFVVRGYDGSNYVDAAFIRGEVDGTPGLNDMPGRLVFSTTADGASSPTERMRITSDAYVRLASGTGGIQFNGDTAAANALDDYEEGSWTPVIVGTTAAGTGTYSRQVGRYTKIGSRVVAEGICTWSAHTGTGNIKMTGLPFTLSNAANYLTAVALHVNNITSPAGTIVQAYSPGNLTEIVFTSVATGGGAFASLAMDTAGEFIVSISYTVA